ncbi:MAG: hypothetical protein A3C82_01635 [Candidatus Wildermuthbacteria bacterium RIFCSPHIGHO2_02_FULL_47_12]|uniref:Uncharacterized protein n=1 Tax=Candidatus Wildermuthbacteria bacterium RIFCSPHIGHO2_02_FULL_47_12 TaxID=1802451 RepID=A0A1G2R3A5_9BACT|nr:MAG: hypothetical protein A3C82_01635 [Candidatus Wildermuthbacteria bacterium RIFCSPHIGHO2_02_FULL_47_12]
MFFHRGTQQTVNKEVCRLRHSVRKAEDEARGLEDLAAWGMKPHNLSRRAHREANWLKIQLCLAIIMARLRGFSIPSSTCEDRTVEGEV